MQMSINTLLESLDKTSEHQTATTVFFTYSPTPTPTPTAQCHSSFHNTIIIMQDFIKLLGLAATASALAVPVQKRADESFTSNVRTS